MSGTLAVHLPAVSNPRLSLCQEHAMRTRGYDDLATVEFDGSVDSGSVMPSGKRWGPFAALVETLGDDVDAAIRAVECCGWMNASDNRAWHQRGTEHVPCQDCKEVAYA